MYFASSVALPTNSFGGTTSPTAATASVLELEASNLKIRFRSAAYSEVRDIDYEYHSNSPRTMQACDMLQVLPTIASCPTVKLQLPNTA
jgi:hypothetical protein